jgi:hypothetical protein
MIGFQFDLLGWMALLFVLLGWDRWLVLLLVVSIRWDGISLFAMLRGLFGEMSITTVVLLWVLALQKGRGKLPFAGREAQWLPHLIVVVALLFYPAALGWGALDPYGWGHDEALVLPLIVGTLALVAWLVAWRVSALMLVLALVLWRLSLLESTNLWDYLFDPLLVLGALWVMLARALRTTWARLRARRSTTVS